LRLASYCIHATNRNDTRERYSPLGEIVINSIEHLAEMIKVIGR